MNERRVASELLFLAKELVGIDFPTQDAMDKYLKEHPDADKSNHRVVETKKEGPGKKEESGPASSSEDDLYAHMKKSGWGDKLDVQGKDDSRIESMFEKSSKDQGVKDGKRVIGISESKLKSLTESMAKKIKDPAKAFRRGCAMSDHVRKLLLRSDPYMHDRLKEMPKIFFNRCHELLKGS